MTYEHLRENHLGVHFAWAQNLRLELRRQVDALFETVDVLVTPTWPAGPDRLAGESPAGGSPAAVEPPAAAEPPRSQAPPMMTWTSIFNLTGHPALTVPGGLGDDNLPRGIQFVGRRFDEHAVYRVGSAFEAAVRG